MAFARPSAAEVSYLQARVSGYAGRPRASSVLLPGLAPPERDITPELVQHSGGGGALRVFLRVRPPLDGDFDARPEDEAGVLEMPNSVHLLMHAPKDSATYKNGINGNGKLTHRYTFTHIFRPETNQQQLFNQTTLNHITEFINGHSCLLFTYGATNSGKTYTVQGSPEEPGLLPRALDVVFNSVGGQLYSHLDIQPRGFCEVCRVPSRDEQAALLLKRDALRQGCEPEPAELAASHGSEDSLASSSLYRSQESLALSVESLPDLKCPEIEGRCRETAAVSTENQPHTRFSVWVSFLEIYNEYVYDLLERVPSTKRRTVMHLGLDKKGNTYVKGLREVQVRTADEACQVLRAGRQNLRFASNRLNHNSSRSHCVFTVKLIRMLDTDNPSVARISMFSVCDLAGSERVEKTVAQGLRMKEAGNINTSLMVLGRCMKAMRQNQAKTAAAGGAVKVPYRDSKLTRIFQNYFCGQAARVTMIVNVSPSPIVFDETIQVLKFSALAKQVSVQQAEKRRAPSRFSTMVRRSIRTAAAVVGAAVGRPRPLPDATLLDDTQTDEQHQSLLDLVEKLRQELVEARRENASLEARIREELCEEFTQHMVQIEKDYQQQMQETERFMESRAELQMNVVAKSLKAEYSRKRRRASGSVDGDEDEDETDELKELRERAAAAEQRCLLLEQQQEAEAADRQLLAQRSAQQQEEMTRLAMQLAEARDTAAKLQHDLDDAEDRCRRHLESKADDPLVAQLTQQVAKLQEELRFRDMDLREAKEYLQEGGDEFLQLESANERLLQQATQLQAQLSEREEALRDQRAHQEDLEALLAGQSQRISALETELQRRSERRACGQRAGGTIPEEEEEETPGPAELSFSSRVRSLRTKTGAMLKQVASPMAQDSSRLRSQVETLQAQVSDLTRAHSALQQQNRDLEQKVEENREEAFRQQREVEMERDLAAGESERLLASNQKLSSTIAQQERVMTDLSKRYLAAVTPGRTPAEKRSAPPDLNDTCGFEEAERQLLEEQRREEVLSATGLRRAMAAAEAGDRGRDQDAAEGQNADLPARLATAEAELAELREAKERQTTELQTAADRLAAAEAELAELRAANERQTAELQTATDRLAAESARAVELQAAGEGQTAELQTAADRLAAAEAELAELRAAGGRLAADAAQAGQLRSETERLAAELAELSARLETQRAERERADAELAELRGQLEQRSAELAGQRVAAEARCDELQRRADQSRQRLEEERDLLREQLEAARAAGAAPLAEAQRELQQLQREYKRALHEKTEAEADAAVAEREMKQMRARLEEGQQGDARLLEQLRARDTEVEVLQARVAALTREEEAFSILKAELEAKKEELRQCNVTDLRAQVERSDAEVSHLRDELEKRSNQLLKLNIQIDTLKKKLLEKDEDLQKMRDDRARLMQMSEQSMRRKNDELNRERHESAHLRDMMARITPRSSRLLESELGTARAECRRMEDRIEQLEAQLRACQADTAGATPTPTPTPRRAVARALAVDIGAEMAGTDGEEPDVTPIVLKSRTRSSRKTSRCTTRTAASSDTDRQELDQAGEEAPASRRRTRRATKASVHFTDENDDPETSEGTTDCSASRGGRSRVVLSAITEAQASTPADQAPPPRPANKSTGTKRKLFKRCSDQMLQCSPVEIAEKCVSPRKVVTRSLRSRKK